MVGWFCQGIHRDVRAAMAGRAIAGCQWAAGAVMAHRRRGKRRGVLMAHIALRRGRDMRAGLALGGNAMARGAAAGYRWGDQGVIEVCSSKSSEALMANIALRSGGDMVGRFGQCIHRDIRTAMAGRAIAGGQGATGTGMTHLGRGEGRGIGMASIALRRGRNVRGRFALGGNAMARGAAAGHRRGD